MLFEIDTLLLAGLAIISTLALAFAVRPFVRRRNGRSAGAVSAKGNERPL